MNNLENLKRELAQDFEVANFQFLHTYGDDSLIVSKDFIVPLLSFFKRTGQFDFLMDVCGADYPNREKRFEVVYHLFNSKNARRLRVKVPLAENEQIDLDASILSLKTSEPHLADREIARQLNTNPVKVGRVLRRSKV